MKVVCDIEANGLAPDKVWCVVAYDIEDKKEYIFTYKDNFKGLKDFAGRVSIWIGHNFLSYDRPALNTLLGLDIKVAQVKDTLVLSRLFNVRRKGGHSLENFGILFGLHKKQHEDWSQYSEAMLERCRVDVQLNCKVYELLKKESEGYSQECITLEHNIQYLLDLQKRTGFYFDQQKAHALLSNCSRDADIIRNKILSDFGLKPKLSKCVELKRKKDGSLSIVGLKKVGNDALKIVGGNFSLINWQEFNLSSPKQVVERLNEAGWEPEIFNKLSDNMKESGLTKGTPKICEENLDTLPDTAPESAKLIAQYLLLISRCRNIKTWFDALGSDSRIHGSVIGVGASTHRMSHINPNTANIPATLNRRGKVALYGKECRECWTVPKGRVLVGVDASGIQLRVLCHYMQDAAYTFAVVHGKKEDGSDIHTVNQKAGGFGSREQAKTFIYAWLLGAGDEKVGTIKGVESKLRRTVGKQTSQQFLEAIPALARVKDMAEAAFKRGFMIGIDGRRVQITSKHKALSVYLQAGEATIMKKAYIFAYNRIKKLGLDAKIVSVVHDEFIVDSSPIGAEQVKTILINAIVQAGEYYKLRCPLNGEGKIGKDWSEIH